MAVSYKYKFISEPPDSLKCLICLDVAEEPWQHAKCGRLFCRKCIEDYGKTKLCPFCRNKKPQYFEDNKSKHKMHAVPVSINLVGIMGGGLMSLPLIQHLTELETARVSLLY